MLISISASSVIPVYTLSCVVDMFISLLRTGNSICSQLSLGNRGSRAWRCCGRGGWVARNGKVRRSGLHPFFNCQHSRACSQWNSNEALSESRIGYIVVSFGCNGSYYLGSRFWVPYPRQDLHNLVILWYVHGSLRCHHHGLGNRFPHPLSR